MPMAAIHHDYSSIQTKLPHDLISFISIFSPLYTVGNRATFTMGAFNIAILIMITITLLWLFPITRSYLQRITPWAALLGGGLIIGTLLMAPRGSNAAHRTYGGVEKWRPLRRQGKRNGGGHQELEISDDDVFSQEDQDMTDDDADLTNITNKEDEAPGSLGAYVIDTSPEAEELDE